MYVPDDLTASIHLWASQENSQWVRALRRQATFLLRISLTGHGDLVTFAFNFFFNLGVFIIKTNRTWFSRSGSETKKDEGGARPELATLAGMIEIVRKG